MAAALLGGCVSDENGALLSVSQPKMPLLSAVVAPAPIPTAMPWQLTPASTASIAQGEQTIIIDNRRFGRVKGTPLAIANLEKPVIAFARRGAVVVACKKTIEPQAKNIGAYSIQAAAAGPERRNRDGGRFQQVFFRVIYDHPDYLEVRQSSLLCSLDRSGMIVDARPI